MSSVENSAIPFNNFHCLPTADFQNRFCLHWKMIPGLLTLVANVTAVVCAVIWGYTNWCILFAPSTLASVYLIYLGWDAQNLRSLTENNHELRESISHLQEERENLTGQIQLFRETLQTMENELMGLQDRINQFEAENQRLQQTSNDLSNAVQSLELENTALTANNEQLKTINGELQNTNEDLQQANEELKGTLVSLERLKETLETKAKTHVDQLANLENSLTGLETAVERDHTSFATHLAQFVAEVRVLQQTSSDLKEAVPTIENDMARVVELFESIFTRVNEWRNDATIIERVKNQQVLNNNLCTLKEEIAKNEVLLKMQAQQLEELNQIKTSFGDALQNLLSRIEEIRTVRGELAQETAKVAEAARVLQNYDFKINRVGESR